MQVQVLLKHVKILGGILSWTVLSFCQPSPTELTLNKNWYLYTGQESEVTKILQKIPTQKISQNPFWQSIEMPGRLRKQNFSTQNGYYFLLNLFEYKFSYEFPGIFLGEIKSVDETYLNGSLIGRSGRFPPHLNQAYDKNRLYPIDRSLLKENNFLLIKAFEPLSQDRAGIKANWIFLDEYEKIKAQTDLQNLLNLICVTCICMISAYFFFIFRNYTFLSEAIYLSLTDFSLAIYLFFYSELKYTLASDFLLLKKIEYLALFSVPYFYLKFVSTSATQSLGKLLTAIKIVNLTSIIYTILAPDVASLMNLLTYWQWVILAELLLAFVLHLFIWDLNLVETKFYSIGYIFIFLVVVLDMMRTWQLHNLGKILPFGVFFGLLIAALGLADKLKKINRGVLTQYKNLIYLSEHNSEDNDLETIVENYFNLLYCRFFITKLTLQIKTENFQKIIFSDPILNQEAQRWQENHPNRIILNETDYSPDFNEMMKPYSLKNYKVFFFQLIINDKVSGYLCGVIYFIKQNRNFIHVLRLLKQQLETIVGRKEISLKLAQVNLNLENIIEEKTKVVRRQNKKLTKLNEIKSKIFANITHDIKTPLSLITIPLELFLMRSGNLNEDQKNFLQRIKFNTFKTIEMVNGLLDWTKSESGKIKFNPLSFDIGKYVEGWIIEFCQPLMSKYQIITQVEKKTVYSLIDPEKFEKILVNLLSNAIKHQSEDKPLYFELEFSDDTFQIRITNSGDLIPRSEIGNIFKRYKQINDENGRYINGSGLGLSIVKDFVNLHQGKIRVHSDIDSGTSFVLTFPILSAETTTGQRQWEYPTTRLLSQKLLAGQGGQDSIAKQTDIYLITSQNQTKDFSDLQHYFHINTIILEDLKLPEIQKRLARVKTHKKFAIFIINLDNGSREIINKIMSDLPPLQQLFIPAIMIAGSVPWRDYGYLKKNYFDMIIKKPYFFNELHQSIYLLLSQFEIRQKFRSSTRQPILSHKEV